MRHTHSTGIAPLIQGILISILISGMAVMLYGQQAPKIKNTTISPTSASSGEEMFKAYCAVCHGTDAKGTGPAAPALKKPPADLTVLTKNNNGKFPEMKVFQTIVGDNANPVHGSKDMPVWGTLFRSLDRSSGVEQLRVRNLTMYVQGLQK
jgi:mono/diheme cytochrome c family protein